MFKTIFRRIGGRIVPIRVQTAIEKGAYGEHRVTLRATEAFGRIGEVWGDQSIKRKSRFFVGSHLNPEFRGHGLGTELYKELADTIRKLGGKTLHGTTANVETIGKIRAKIGKTRAFPDKDVTTYITRLGGKKK